MTTDEGPTFNIIYIRGTVHRLLPFALTLLRHAPRSRFRLVSNGCTSSEEQELESLCDSHERASFHSLGKRRILKHGEALNALFEIEDSPWFAFMDSDIFAVAPFMEEIEEALRERAAVFSCLPVWHEPDEVRMPPGFAIAGGRFLYAAGGHLLGVSYLAAYRSDALRACMRRTSVDFMRREAGELSPSHKAALRASGVDAAIYDTGKVLNVMLQQQEAAKYIHIPGLVHIGAFSGLLRRTGSLRGAVRERIVRLMPPGLLRAVRWLRRSRPRVSDEEATSRVWLQRRRTATQAYTVALMERGEGDAELHIEGIGAELSGVVREVGRQVTHIHQEYRVWRRGAEPALRTAAVERIGG